MTGLLPNLNEHGLRGTMYVQFVGSMISTAAVAAFIAVSGVVLVFSGKIRAYFSRLRRKSREGKEADGETQK